MMKVDLSGTWDFCLDKEKEGIEKKFYQASYEDTINLPTTVSEAKKSRVSKLMSKDHLTDPYLFEGYTWYSREVEFPEVTGKQFFLVLERTRTSHIWIDDQYVGSCNSLCCSHKYNITSFIKKPVHKLTIMIDNTSYPVKGGHMTSPDTQTNWNGITGGIYLKICNEVYLSDVRIYPDAQKRQITVKVVLHGTVQLRIAAVVKDDDRAFPGKEFQLEQGENTFTYPLDETAKLWSEHTPDLYRLQIQILPGYIGQPVSAAAGQNQNDASEYVYSFGLRDFKAAGKYFEINGRRTFLRGKHDGMIFPMTGYAPTDLDSWLKVLRTAKEYGINHYRFHTCCPPEAAFAAADIVGIYMQPELPFWGTVTEEGEQNHDEKAQQYLIEEGYRILDEFGNHPSFALMSLGNELWGSQNRLNQILGGYKKYDNRHLYTQGSNNFQFVPCVLENDDFFSGVRFSRDRLFRGSYAMCDAPQGHIQTASPDMSHNYDSLIRPDTVSEDEITGEEVMIQYGTGTKTVKTTASEELIPALPVVSHEIGQYAMYPDFSEIEKYTGVLKARNMELFKRRLKKEGMLSMAEPFFKASGRLAAECYKAELETALRSKELAGFQILDLQDFTGQGTALVGILNAFLENKGLISASEWRQFCSDTVLLAELPKLVFHTGERISVTVKLAYFKPELLHNPVVELQIAEGSQILLAKSSQTLGEYSCGVYEIGEFDINLPELKHPGKLSFDIRLSGTEVKNHYDIWVYPEQLGTVSHIADQKDIIITDNTEEAFSKLSLGSKVLLFPKNLDASNSIPGTYCTDFWCYPMFRSISESMGRPVPVGTLGLFINQKHPVFKEFPTEYYSTPQWYDIISNSQSCILDRTELEPIVWNIDNFERNHRLGVLFELSCGEGKLFVCTADLRTLPDSLPAAWLMQSIVKYMKSAEFRPSNELELKKIKKIFTR